MKTHSVFLGGLALGAVTLLLGAILAPNFVRARYRSPTTACKSNLKNIGTAMEMYSMDHDGKYPRNLSFLTPNYLKTIPECHMPGSLGYFAEFGPGAALNEGFVDYYYLECVGTGHEDYGIPRNFPAYDGIQGLIERP